MPILYKYLTYDSAEKLLEYSTLQFSRPVAFNDPFDSIPKDNEKGSPFEGIDHSDLFVLCLTRSPANALMWAHYANEHSGVVIGFDIDKIKALHEDCFIPVTKGEIIYTKTRPPKSMTAKKFLYKSLEWSYEEEVRVVKRAKYLTDFNKEGLRKALNFPQDSIKELYIGCNFNRRNAADDGQYYDNVVSMFGFIDLAREKFPEIEVKMFRTCSESWELRKLNDCEFSELRHESVAFTKDGMNGLYDYWNE